ncbi:MAG: ferredoxin [Acidimicrobiales bacterium]|nr:ferredoxin [Acidimicrobiales bacterium]
MGRITGVTAAETRQRLLQAAAAAFESQGFEGTRVADIAGAAGVSNGALYTHFGSKAELLAEALRDHGSTELASLFLDDPDSTVVDLLVLLGRGLIERPADHGALVVEALVAARRDDEVAGMMGGHLRDRHDWLAGVIRDGQAEGTFDPELSPEVVSRYCLMLLLGSILLRGTGLPAVDADEWAAFVARLGDALRPRSPAPSRPAPTDTPRRSAMKVHVDQERCQGHGRCYSLAPELFEPDEIGNSVEIGDGTVPPGLEEAARKAVLNCPEQAISLEEDAT